MYIENGKIRLDYKMVVKIASMFVLCPDDSFISFNVLKNENLRQMANNEIKK